MQPNELAPLTERDIAEYLIQNPGFFERHTDLLTSVQLGSAHGQRVVNLHERQAEMLRDKIKVLEQRLIEMIRHGSDNSTTTNRLLKWATHLFLEFDPAALPDRICRDMVEIFLVPQAALRVWGGAPEYADRPFAQGASNDARIFASSLTAPYCGMHVGVEAVKWLPEPTQAASLALIPLRPVERPSAPAFGMLVLSSPDSQRYTDDMGTEFLERIGEIASAALSRLLLPSAKAAGPAPAATASSAPASRPGADVAPAAQNARNAQKPQSSAEPAPAGLADPRPSGHSVPVGSEPSGPAASQATMPAPAAAPTAEAAPPTHGR